MPKKRTLVELSLDDIRPGHNYRDDAKRAEIAELAASIEEIGLIEPIIVGPPVRGKHPIIAGERRFHALRQLKRTKVEALVEEDEQKAAIIAAAENAHRRSLSPIETAKAVADLRKQGRTDEQIARHLNCSAHSLDRYIGLLSLPKTTQDAVAQGYISLPNAFRLLSLANKGAVQQITTTAINGGLSDRELSHHINQVCLYLSAAPFSTKTPFAVPKGNRAILTNPCSECQHCTAAQADLFEGAVFKENGKSAKASCLNAACYTGRWDAVLNDLAASLEAEGVTVIRDVKALPASKSYGQYEAVFLSGVDPAACRTAAKSDLPDGAQVNVLLLSHGQVRWPFRSHRVEYVSEPALVKALLKRRDSKAPDKTQRAAKGETPAASEDTKTVPVAGKKLIDLVRSDMTAFIQEAFLKASTGDSAAKQVRPLVLNLFSYRLLTKIIPSGAEKHAMSPEEIDSLLQVCGFPAKATKAGAFSKWLELVANPANSEYLFSAVLRYVGMAFVDWTLANEDLASLSLILGYRFLFTRPMAETLSKAELIAELEFMGSKTDTSRLESAKKGEILDAIFDPAVKWDGHVPLCIRSAFSPLTPPKRAAKE